MKEQEHVAAAPTTVPSPLDSTRRHLSSARAAMAEMFGGHLEESSTGAVVTTSAGEEFLNCAGYGVFLMGACHPRITAAVVEQVLRHPLSSRILLEPIAAEAARTLAGVCPPGLEKVHFTNSGAEAVETALKLARANGARRLVTTVGGYHGKTLGALSVTARALYQRPFEPLLPDVAQIPFGDTEALGKALDHEPRSCFIVEPVQGEAGVILPPPGYLGEVGRTCREHGAFLVVDETLTGLGRLGRWWGSGDEDVRPDVMVVGKALSGGVVPVAAAVATAQAYRPFDRDPFLHTSTFSAAPIAVAAARAAIEVIKDEDLVGAAANTGARLRRGIAAAAQRCPHLVGEVRGQGVLIGVELADPGIAGELLLALLERRILVNHSLNNSAVIRLTPPANLHPRQADTVIAAFDAAFQDLAQSFSASSRPEHEPAAPTKGTTRCAP
jgi:putrescine aminotransferase